jgi:hypothetical protein
MRFVVEIFSRLLIQILVYAGTGTRRGCLPCSGSGMGREHPPWGLTGTGMGKKISRRDGDGRPIPDGEFPVAFFNTGDVLWCFLWCSRNIHVMLYDFFMFTCYICDVLWYFLCSRGIRVMFYNVFCDVRVIYNDVLCCIMWCSMIFMFTCYICDVSFMFTWYTCDVQWCFCDAHVVYMWCSHSI